ncbi:MAG: hypothetical protein YK1312THETA_660003 [Marine Group I thaumarchaeote]|nr:MAG: hypothetical protein YK1312THETA_660003 [Marine Group I thaumarchaeote]
MCINESKMIPKTVRVLPDSNSIQFDNSVVQYEKHPLFQFYF